MKGDSHRLSAAGRPAAAYATRNGKPARGHQDEVIAAIAAGACGYVTREASPDFLIAGLREVASGGSADLA